MRKHLLTGLGLAAALVVGTAVAGDVVSGPQVDKQVPGPFHPLNVTGEKAGEKNCLVCQNGDNPVAMIFAREVTPTLTTLIKKVDAETAKNKGCSMGSFIVFCSDKEGLESELKTLAQKNNIKNTILAIDNPAGPKAYNVNRDAEVTVVLYTERMVKANYAFKKGELKDADVEKIVADVSKITKK
jgi:hypothetical protein